jgi:hypothetical protein
MKLGMQEFVLLSFAWMDKVEYNKGHDMGGARWSTTLSAPFLPPPSLKAFDRVQAPPRLNLDYFRFVLFVHENATHNSGI